MRSLVFFPAESLHWKLKIVRERRNWNTPPDIGSVSFEEHFDAPRCRITNNGDFFRLRCSYFPVKTFKTFFQFVNCLLKIFSSEGQCDSTYGRVSEVMRLVTVLRIRNFATSISERRQLVREGRNKARGRRDDSLKECYLWIRILVPHAIGCRSVVYVCVSGGV